MLLKSHKITHYNQKKKTTTTIDNENFWLNKWTLIIIFWTIFKENVVKTSIWTKIFNNEYTYINSTKLPTDIP